MEVRIYLLYVFSVLFFHALTASASLTSELDSYLQACTDRGYFSGSVLIAKGNDLLLNKGYGLSNQEHNIPNSPATKFRLSSLSKPFVSLAIMQLEEKGMLSVSDLLSQYIPDYPRGTEITIHQLLTHTSGIKNYTTLAEFQTFKKLPTTIIQLIERFKYLGLASNPGQVYKFCNSNYALLSYIIERVTGKPYYAYVIEHIFKPLGMHNSGHEASRSLIPNRTAGYTIIQDEIANADYIDMTNAVGLGTFYSTVEDMYLFDRALYTTMLASADSLALMLKPQVYIGDKEDNIMYGYGWATIQVNGHTVKKHISGIDGFSGAMYRFIDNDMFIIVLSNFQHAITEPLSFELAGIVFGVPYTMPKEYMPISLDSSLLEAYAGEYGYKQRACTISKKADFLYLQLPDKPLYRLIPYSETEFFIQGVPIQAQFILNEQGQTTHLVTRAFGKERRMAKK